MESRFDDLTFIETKKPNNKSSTLNLIWKISSCFSIMKYYGYLDQAYELGMI